MTFSLAAYDPATGQFGAASTTSDIAVGARVQWLRRGVGVVITQHTTDPRLGAAGIDLLGYGFSAESVLRSLSALATVPEARQLAVVGAAGAAAWSGGFVDPRHGYAAAGDRHAVVGNMLQSPGVGQAIFDSYLADTSVPFALRLVRALQAGVDAGGETQELRSAALTVVADDPFPYCDLRVDRAENPVAELRSLAEEVVPRAEEYRRRAYRPDVSYAADYADISAYRGAAVPEGGTEERNHND